MARREDEDLMAYLDGELAPRDARAVEDRLRGAAEARTKVEAMKELSGVLQGHYEAAADAVEPRMAELWSRLEARIDKEAPAAAAAAKRPGLLTGIREWFDSYRSHVLVGAACAAAGALLALALQEPRAVERPVIVKVPVETPQRPEQGVVAVRGEDGKVEGLEVNGGTGMVFQIPAEDEGQAAATVIWVTRDEPTGPEGPI